MAMATMLQRVHPSFPPYQRPSRRPPPPSSSLPCRKRLPLPLLRIVMAHSHFVDEPFPSPLPKPSVQSGNSQDAQLPHPIPITVEKTVGGGVLTQKQQKTTEEVPKQKEQLRARIIFGLMIGAGALGVVLIGGWVFAATLSVVVLIGTDEYFSLLASHGKMAPPPSLARRVCSAVCALMPMLTMYFGGRVGVALTMTAFALVAVVLIQRQKPQFSQLSSAIFGLFYCGYLPCFWVKLRCCLNVPSLNTNLVEGWPVLLGGRAHWTIGLLATLISISSVIAADTGAFVGGKMLGRTPFTIVSPKKTLEGAAAGLVATIAVSLLLARVFLWPSSLISAGVLGSLIFLASLFGDLTESMIKRDVGAKDSSRLIPGHGGILDRADSYIFTGALVYFFVKFGLPLYGL